MTKENAKDWMIALRANYRADGIIANAFTIAIKALEQIRDIEGIIDVSNIIIQEDVLKYKMIVDVVKGNDAFSEEEEK